MMCVNVIFFCLIYVEFVTYPWKLLYCCDEFKTYNFAIAETLKIVTEALAKCNGF